MNLLQSQAAILKPSALQAAKVVSQFTRKPDTKSPLTHSRPRRPEQRQVLLSPLAWLKLQLFLHAGETEIGGFGLSSAHDPLYIEQFLTVRQKVSAVTVAFDDEAVADYFDDCIDRGLVPGRFARVWVHTHPGKSPEPSSVDEETFARVFGGCDWALMLIVSRTLATYARLSFQAGPGGSLLLPVQVDWAAWPQLLLDRSGELSGVFEQWMDEYGLNIHPARELYSMYDLQLDPVLPDDSLSLDSDRLDLPDRPRSSRMPWSQDLWREEAIYGVHEELAQEQQFGEFYSASLAEGR